MTKSQHPARFVSSSTEPIGLIGIGLMGTVIAARLLRANYHIIGWDLVPERCRALTDAGGKAASGIAEIITSCRRIVLSLPTHETVAEYCKMCASCSARDRSLSIPQREILSPRARGLTNYPLAGSSISMRPSRAAARSCATVPPCSWSVRRTRRFSTIANSFRLSVKKYSTRDRPAAVRA